MLEKIKVGPKLISGFLLVAIIAGAIGVIGMINLTTIDEADKLLYKNITLPISQLLKITEAFQRIRINVRDLADNQTNEEKTKIINTINDLSKIIEENSSSFEKTILTDIGKKDFEEFVGARKVYRGHLDEIIKFINQGKLQEAKFIIDGDAKTAALAEQAAIDKLVESKLSIAKETSNNNTNLANLSRIVMTVAIFIGVILAISLGISLTISITKPLRILTEGIGYVSKGDIQIKKINPKDIQKINSRGDELGKIGNALFILIAYIKEKEEIAKTIADGNLIVDAKIASDEDDFGKAFSQMIASLNEILGQVNTSIDMISSGSNQVSSASQSLSQGATEQASSLEEITSSVTQINSQAKQNSENAMQANQMAKQAMEGANLGNKQMKELIVAMADINKSADGIKKIAKAIDDIAFQINLLALNANVEAARAGKYGKGFAVVADEVRNLAVRSGNSVKEATQMVEEAIKNITNGTKMVEITAKQIEDIVNIASKVANIAEEVTSASKEQSQGLDQINIGLGQIDQVTQANTASAEETASAAEELSSQSVQLKGMIAKFKLKEQRLLTNNNAVITKDMIDLIRKQIEKENS
ncbi:MAG: hypothetical protein A2086_05520 [Spirochaetes bacterium GWD1_27_9]|nr:MAG: hypothetical protein A2Z98_16655 [Spirochaetes bacterium GWB1_27_13]OHD37830.1 MAG: hypothetical protein A2086_05520 [Spirochaetes bacterium GWD1_27_9]